MTLKLIALFASTLFVSATMLPAEIFTYTGQKYYATTGQYRTTESISGTFTFSVTLAANLNHANVLGSLTAWNVADGYHTYCNSCTGFQTAEVFRVSTNAAGNIIDWYWKLSDGKSGGQGDTGNNFDESGGTGGIGRANGLVGDLANADTGDSQGMANVGAFSKATGTTVPEPGTISLMMAGMILLAGLRQKRGIKSDRPVMV